MVNNKNTGRTLSKMVRPKNIAQIIIEYLQTIKEGYSIKPSFISRDTGLYYDEIKYQIKNNTYLFNYINNNFDLKIKGEYIWLMTKKQNIYLI